MDMYIPLMTRVRTLVIGVYYHILREASACLLVLLYRAIPEPQRVGRATVRLSRISFYSFIANVVSPEAVTKQFYEEKSIPDAFDSKHHLPRTAFSVKFHFRIYLRRANLDLLCQ